MTPYKYRVKLPNGRIRVIKFQITKNGRPKTPGTSQQVSEHKFLVKKNWEARNARKRYVQERIWENKNRVKRNKQKRLRRLLNKR